MKAPRLATVRALVDHLKAHGAQFKVCFGGRIRDARCNCPLAVACHPFDSCVTNHTAGSGVQDVFGMPAAVARTVIYAADNYVTGRPAVAEARGLLMELVR